MRRLRVVLIKAIFALTIGAAMLIGQVPTAGRVDQAVSSNPLEGLKTKASQLQAAIEAGDVDRTSNLVDELQLAVYEIRKNSLREGPRQSLTKLEKALAEQPKLRPMFVHYAAFLAEMSGDFVSAKRYANETLGLASKGAKDEAKNTYYGNHVLGLVALHDGDTGAARYYLLASIDNAGWPGMDEFGPNLTLAQRLLERGEREAVIEYLERCKKIWSRGGEKLKQWLAILRAGSTPDLTRSSFSIP